MSQQETVRSMLTSADVAQLPIRDRIGLVIEARDVTTAITRIREAEYAGIRQAWMTQSVGMLDTLTLFAPWQRTQRGSAWAHRLCRSIHVIPS